MEAQSLTSSSKGPNNGRMSDEKRDLRDACAADACAQRRKFSHAQRLWQRSWGCPMKTLPRSMLVAAVLGFCHRAQDETIPCVMNVYI
eukprot:1157302-Pelagomonas_calceolata.AAC.7